MRISKESAREFLIEKLIYNKNNIETRDGLSHYNLLKDEIFIRKEFIGKEESFF